MTNFETYLANHENKCEVLIGLRQINVSITETEIEIDSDFGKLIVSRKITDPEEALTEYLEKVCKLEVRFCEECGKPYDQGYVADGGFWYSCEDCFEEAMDKSYGKGRWRGSEKEGGFGG